MEESGTKGEIIISLNSGMASVTIKGTNDEAMLTQLLATSLEAIYNNRERIIEVLGSHPASIYPSKQKAIGKDIVNDVPSSMQDQLEPGLEGKVEIIDDYVKFVSTKSFELLSKEAVAVVMYVLERPLKPKAISAILVKGWKKVSNVSDELAKTDKLKKYVARTKEGYILTQEGKRWVVQVVLPKL